MPTVTTVLTGTNEQHVLLVTLHEACSIFSPYRIYLYLVNFSPYMIDLYTTTFPLIIDCVKMKKGY